MNDDTLFLVIAFIVFLLCAGDPDMLDAINHNLIKNNDIICE